MQHENKNSLRKFYLGMIGFLWVAGLLAAGSEGEYMPWVNGFGLCVFLLSSVLLGRSLHQGSSKACNPPCTKSREKSIERSGTVAGDNCRIRIRYA